MKINPYVKFYFEDPDDSGFGGGGDPTGGDPSGSEPQVQTPQAPPAFDPKALASAFGDALKQHLPQQQQAPQRTLTPEEAKKMLNLWEPDDNFLQQFGNLDTQKQALLAMRDGMTKQFMTIMEMFVGEREQDIHKRYEPIQQYYQSQQAEAREKRFQTSFPQLAEPKFKPIVDAVLGQLQQSGASFNSEAEGFTALAKGVEAVIKQVNPEFQLTAGTPAKTKPLGNPNALPSSTSGSGVGGGSGGGTSKPAPKGHALKFL